jgi:hypothetical protein
VYFATTLAAGAEKAPLPLSQQALRKYTYHFRSAFSAPAAKVVGVLSQRRACCESGRCAFFSENRKILSFLFVWTLNEAISIIKSKILKNPMSACLL